MAGVVLGAAGAIVCEVEGMAHFVAGGFCRRVFALVEHQGHIIGAPVEAVVVGSPTTTGVFDGLSGEQVEVAGEGHPDAPAIIACAEFAQVFGARVLGGDVDIEGSKVFGHPLPDPLDFRECVRIQAVVKALQAQVAAALPGGVGNVMAVEVEEDRLRGGGVAVKLKHLAQVHPRAEADHAVHHQGGLFVSDVPGFGAVTAAHCQHGAGPAAAADPHGRGHRVAAGPGQRVAQHLMAGQRHIWGGGKGDSLLENGPLAAG